MIRILELLYLVDVRRNPKTGKMMDSNNLTLISLVLVKFGPMPEPTCTIIILLIQCFSSLVGFGIRYALPYYLYK
jgi:UDP-N-acetylglucosamine--dolichyl-phosphate N-acetylglucosaminephosphotransferase